MTAFSVRAYAMVRAAPVAMLMMRLGMRLAATHVSVKGS